MMDTLFRLAQSYGIPLTLLIFFIWRDWKREQAMNANIKELTDTLLVKTSELDSEMRTILKDLVTKTTTALVDNTNVMRQIITAINHIPCFRCDKYPNEIKRIE